MLEISDTIALLKETIRVTSLSNMQGLSEPQLLIKKKIPLPLFPHLY